MTTGFIAGGVLILALIGWSIWLMRRGGDIAEGDAAKKGLDDARDARKTAEAVRDLSDDDLNKRLRGDK